MRLVVKALNKDALDRNKYENEELYRYFKEVKCFKDLNIGVSDLMKLINCITLLYVPKHEVLFRVGEQGTTFYVSLTGKCQLFIKNPEQKVLKHRIQEQQQELGDLFEQLENFKNEAV